MPKASTYPAVKKAVAKPAAKTPEQRKADRLAKQAREAQERTASDAAEAKRQAEFMAALPAKLLNLMAKTTTYDGVRYHVDGGTESSLLRVNFEFDEMSDSAMDHRLYDDTVLIYAARWNYDVERNLETIENLFKQRDDFLTEVKRLRGVATEAYNLLSDEQRKALGVRKPF